MLKSKKESRMRDSFLLYRKYCVVIKLKSTDSYRSKNAPLWIALRLSGIMLLVQPAAGGESCRGRILFYAKTNKEPS